MASLPGRQKGFLVESGPNGTVEHETFTCCHCNRPKVVPHRATPEEAGGFCMRCMQMTCHACGGTGRCEPFEKKIEAYEARSKMLQSFEPARY